MAPYSTRRTLARDRERISVSGGTFARNQFITAAPAGGVAWLSNCHGIDFRTSTWRDASGRPGYATPAQTGGSSGNQF